MIPLVDTDDMDKDSFDVPFIPYKISNEHTRIIAKSSPEITRTYASKLIAMGWKFYAVNQDRGRCYYRHKVITIPVWVIEIRGTKLCWYFSHEMAHAYSYINGTNDVHGPHFMKWLKKICPANCIHHELDYKPRNAAAAGIGKPKKLPFLEL